MLGSGAWQTRKRKLSVFIAHIYGFIVHHIAHEADNYTVKYELGNQLRSLGKSFHELVMVCSHDGISSFHTHFDLFNLSFVYHSLWLLWVMLFDLLSSHFLFDHRLKAPQQRDFKIKRKLESLKRIASWTKGCQFQQPCRKRSLPRCSEQNTPFLRKVGYSFKIFA